MQNAILVGTTVHDVSWEYHCDNFHKMNGTGHLVNFVKIIPNFMVPGKF